MCHLVPPLFCYVFLPLTPSMPLNAISASVTCHKHIIHHLYSLFFLSSSVCSCKLRKHHTNYLERFEIALWNKRQSSFLLAAMALKLLFWTQCEVCYGLWFSCQSIQRHKWWRRKKRPKDCIIGFYNRFDFVFSTEGHFFVQHLFLYISLEHPLH